MRIRIYDKERDRDVWDRLAAESRQGTLLHRRAYMDYHSDRFRDCSLIAERDGKPLALLPADISADGTLHSHRGLTYGGWLTPTAHFDGTDMLRLFEAWREWCLERGIGQIVYKPVPHIYHKLPAEEDLYALFRVGAELRSVNLSSAIYLRANPGMNTQQKRHLKKATALNPGIWETQDACEFMEVVANCLKERHGVHPVHTAREMQALKDAFPEGIRMFLCGAEGEPEAAACVYDTNGVAHTQYLATTEAGRRNGTLTFLLSRLIDDTFGGCRWFDLGTSNEDGGRILNEGLLHQKYGLGARGIAYATYTWRLQ